MTDRLYYRYPKIFWDNPKLASATPCELKSMLAAWRNSDSPLDKAHLKDFVRRMIERGGLFDAYIFLKPEEARSFFENETAWFLDGRLDAHFCGLPRSFPIKRHLGGNPMPKKSCW